MVHPIIKAALVGGAGFGLGYGLGVSLNMNPISLAYFCALELILNEASENIPMQNKLSVRLSICIVENAVSAISAVAFGVFSKPVAIVFFTLIGAKIIISALGQIQSAVSAEIAQG